MEDQDVDMDAERRKWNKEFRVMGVVPDNNVSGILGEVSGDESE